MAKRKRRAATGRADPAPVASSSKRARRDERGDSDGDGDGDGDERELPTPPAKRRKSSPQAQAGPSVAAEDDDGDRTSDTLDVDAAVAAAATLVDSPSSTAHAQEHEHEHQHTLKAAAAPADAVELDDEPSALAGLTPEQRRAAKGKGKAADPPPKSDRQKELDVKDNLINQQAALLASLRSSMACNVCLETLDKPFSLACGHVFCRKCLVTWFHRPDPSADEHPAPASPHSSNGSDGSSSGDDDDIMLGSASSSRSSRSPSHDTIQGASSDVIVCDPEDEDARSESDSDESDSPARPVIRGSLGGRNFTVAGVADDAAGDQIWQAMESRLMAAAADRGVDAAGAGPSRALEHPSADALRAARLARFAGPTDGAVVSTTPARLTAVSASAAEAGGDPAPVAHADVAMGGGDLEPSVPDSMPAHNSSPSAPPPPPPPPPPAAAPTGAHRQKNLVCPQCRAAVSTDAPFRIFALSDMVALVRQAEATGVLAGTGSAEPTTDSHPSPAARGMDEADQTWGGLFRAPGTAETKQEKRVRQAQVVHDRDDGVRRCFDCNWELDDEGTCEGCGRQWEISEDGMSDADALGFLLPLGGPLGGRNVDSGSDRSHDSDSDRGSDDEGFIDDGPPDFVSDDESDESEDSRANAAARRAAREAGGPDYESPVSDASTYHRAVARGGRWSAPPSPPPQRHRDGPPSPAARRRNHEVVVLSSDDEESADDRRGGELEDAVESGSDSDSDQDARASSGSDGHVTPPPRRGRRILQLELNSDEEDAERPRRHVDNEGSDAEESGSGEGSRSGSGTGEEQGDGSASDEELSPKPAYRKRRIVEDEESD